MFARSFTIMLAASALAAPLPWKREVPQEHSHEATLREVRALLQLNNPDNILDPVFGLLGAAAAATGKGNIADPDCLHQATADQAFSNAKAAGNVDGMVSALTFRALERNTLGVGVKSPLCTSLAAVNPEIAALTQHQDPASDGAAATNKAITLELAKQIAAVGGDPILALKAGTFAPGQIGDPTARGNSCNDENDAIGCIISQNLLVPDATEDEILAAVGGVVVEEPAVEEPDVEEPVVEEPVVEEPVVEDPPAVDCPPNVTVTVTASAAPTATASQEVAAIETPAAVGNTGAAVGGNLQKFIGAIGGQAAPAVNPGGRGFVVTGSDDFLNVGAALNRSCDIQHNKCANFANSAAGRAAGVSVGNCDTQNNACKALI